MRTLFKFNNIYMHTLFYYFSNLYEMYLKLLEKCPFFQGQEKDGKCQNAGNM